MKLLSEELKKNVTVIQLGETLRRPRQLRVQFRPRKQAFLNFFCHVFFHLYKAIIFEIRYSTKLIIYLET